MSPPLVSIIVPAYNAAHWICEAIDSALAQTWTAREIIIIDDGSTDDTSALVWRTYGERVTCVRQENRGLSAARNLGLAVARGEFVQFLDADDVLLPTKVATHVQALRGNPDVSVAYSDFAYFHNDTRRRRPSGFLSKYQSGDLRAALLHGNFIVVHAAFCRRTELQELGGFAEDLAACEDYDLWLRVAGQSRTFLHTPEILVLYRRRRDSLSRNWTRQIAATIEVVERTSGSFQLDHELREIRTERLALLNDLLVIVMVREAAILLASGRPRAAGRVLAAAARQTKFSRPGRCGRIARALVERARNVTLRSRDAWSEWT